MSQPKKDDWLKVRRTIAEADAIKRNKKIRAVKDIGKTVINRYRLPLCKINKDGSSYKLDENGNKIPVVHTRKGKKRVVTRKAVSFKDLTSYYLMAPKIAYIKDIPVSVVKAVQAIGLIKLHHSLKHQPYNLDKIIKDERQSIKDIESGSKQMDQYNTQAYNSDDDSTTSNEDQQQNNDDSDKASQTDNDQNDTGNSDNNNLNPDNI